LSSGLWIETNELDGAFSSDENAGEAIAMASHILWAFSGRKFSRVRTVTERYECPCRGGRGWVPASQWNVYPTLDGGGVRNVSGADCGCKFEHTRLRLRGTPVRAVLDVRGPSGAVDPSLYRVENSQYLTLLPGGPRDVCGLEVEYRHGSGIPGGGRLATKLLSQELLRAWSGDDECRLPDRVTNVSRQGISFTVLDKQEFLDELRTGILEVDMFLRAVNPDRARRRARVFSPDLPKAYRTTVSPEPTP
jgi:hypothetical protein